MSEDDKRAAEIRAISAILEELEMKTGASELIHRLRQALTVYIGNRQLEEIGA